MDFKNTSVNYETLALRVFVAAPMMASYNELDAAMEHLSDAGYWPVAPDDTLQGNYRDIIECGSLALYEGWENDDLCLEARRVARKLKMSVMYWNSRAQAFEFERIIGLSGYARSGKDTVAHILCQDYGFERRAFADPMREMLYGMNPLILADFPSTDGYLRPMRLHRIVDQYGWDKAKEGSEVRSLLQRLGTEGGREKRGDDFWVDMLFEAPHGPRLVIPDVRFPNEVKRIKQLGGTVIHITRPGVEAANEHVSESALAPDHYDLKINNESTLENLRQQVEAIIVGERNPHVED